MLLFSQLGIKEIQKVLNYSSPKSHKQKHIQLWNFKCRPAVKIVLNSVCQWAGSTGEPLIFAVMHSDFTVLLQIKLEDDE